MTTQTPDRPLHLPIARYAADFIVEAQPHFTGFPGSAWRGALGHALKRLVCITEASTCSGCQLYRSCAYPYLYDTPPSPDATQMRRYQNAPHPYVLAPHGMLGDHHYRLHFTLIGEANKQLPLFIMALSRAASAGKGIAKGRLQLQRVLQAPNWSDDPEKWCSIYEANGELNPLTPLHAPEIPPVASPCMLHFITPVRLKRDGRHVHATDVRFADLFGNILRRVSMLAYHHAGYTLEADFRGLVHQSRQLQTNNQLSWQDMTRYSNRQHAVMQMGGFVGTMILPDVDIQPFWPYLWLGQWLHAGSGATMGLGRYRISASLPSDIHRIRFAKISPENTHSESDSSPQGDSA